LDYYIYRGKFKIIVEKGAYDRYGLSGNPFRDLSSESVKNIDLLNVNQAIDLSIDVLREEVFEKENKAAVSIIGNYGSGKTHRLLMMKHHCDKNNVFNIFLDMTNETRYVVAGVLEEIINNTRLDAYGKFVNAPKWHKDIKKLVKKVKNNYNPVEVGQAIVDALNFNAPSVLLLNDLHNLETPVDMDNFVKVLQEIIDHSNPGVLVMISCNINYFNECLNKYKSLSERLNEIIVLDGLNKDEAGLLLAKRMLEKRMVDNLEPLYPYNVDSVDVLNEVVGGNPRNLLRIASFVIDQAADSRTMTINEDFVREKINLSKNKTLDEIFNENTMERETINQAANKEIKLPKKGVIRRIGGPKKIVTNTNKSIDSVVNPFKNNSSSNSSVNIFKNQNSSNPIKSFSGNNPGNSEEVSKMVRVKCPKCSRIFTFEVTKDEEKMKCPNSSCDFEGVINKKR